MTKSDWGLIALNAFAAFIAFVGVAENDPDVAVIVSFVAVFALAINSVVIARRSRQRADAKDTPALASARDELDVHTVLDFDARLEALERAQHDAVDAARWRALVESGQVTAPAASADALAGDARRQPVGSR